MQLTHVRNMDEEGIQFLAKINSSAIAAPGIVRRLGNRNLSYLQMRRDGRQKRIAMSLRACLRLIWPSEERYMRFLT